MLTHQIVAGHVQIERARTHDVIKRIAAQIAVQHLLPHGAAFVLTQTDETGVCVELVNRHRLVEGEVMVLGSDALFMGQLNLSCCDLGDLHSVVQPPSTISDVPVT